MTVTPTPPRRGTYNGPFALGASNQNWIGHPDTLRLEVRENGLYLYFLVDTPTNEEIAARVIGMPTDVRWTVQDGVAFFTFRWAGGPWMVAPFSPAILETAPDIRPSVEAGSFRLYDLLIDTRSGTFVNIRALDLGDIFVNRLLSWYEIRVREGKQLWESYSAIVDSVYSTMTNDQLAAVSDRCDRIIV